MSKYILPHTQGFYSKLQCRICKIFIMQKHALEEFSNKITLKIWHLLIKADLTCAEENVPADA